MRVQKFKGKVVVITGGAEEIGKAASEKFGREGATVIIWDNLRESQKSLQQENDSKHPKTFFRQVQTVSFEDVQNAAKQLILEFKKIDVLINNAATLPGATMLNMSQERWQQVIDINLTGVLNSTKAFAPFMVQQNYGRIINTSSFFGDAGQANYEATRSGIIGITKVWSRELGRNGITVNAVAPGFIASEQLNQMNPQQLKSIREKIHVGRFGLPDDVANAYMFLASPESAFISGTILDVDGGYLP